MKDANKAIEISAKMGWLVWFLENDYIDINERIMAKEGE